MDKQSIADELENDISISAAPEAEELLRELIRTQEVCEKEQEANPTPYSNDSGENAADDPVVKASSQCAVEPRSIRQNVALLENAISMLKQNERNILAVSSGATALFSLQFGSLAAVTFLFWFCVSIMLTKLNFLSASYQTSCAEDALLFNRNDKLGKGTLCVPWSRVQYLEERCGKLGRELRIQMKSMKFPFIFKWAFQDLFDYQLFSERVTIFSNDFASPEVYNELLNDLAARTDELAIAFKRLPQVLAEKDTGEKHEQGGELNDDALITSENSLLSSDNYETNLQPDEKVVSYNPHRRMQDSILKVLKRYDGVLIALLIAFAIGTLVLKGLMFAKMIVLFVIGVAAWSCLNPFTNEKAQFSLNKDGVALFWENAFRFGKRKAVSSESPRVPWKFFKRAYVQPASARRAKDGSTLVLMLDKAGPATRHLHILRLLAPKLIVVKETGIELRIKIDGLPNELSRRNLYEGLLANLPEEAIDPSVKECLNPTDVASYTKLWMDSFSTASSRRFEGSLADGHQLRNGEYEIQSFLGAGGQASVYLAKSQSEQFAKTVVLKEFILPAHAGADVSQRSLANIQREFDLMQKLEHENIVRYHDLFVEDHRAYLVLEHVDGPSVRALVDEQGALPESQVLELAESMAKILHHLHSQNPCIIHRDFTPENLILGQDGILKLIDFNVAQELETEATRTIVGKHSYLPPEQFRGKATPQSDIYAFGATLYFMLTGMEPEPISCSHPILHDESISGAMDQLVATATALELADRFQCAEELIEKIQLFSKIRDTAEGGSCG